MTFKKCIWLKGIICVTFLIFSFSHSCHSNSYYFLFSMKHKIRCSVECQSFSFSESGWCFFWHFSDKSHQDAVGSTMSHDQSWYGKFKTKSDCKWHLRTARLKNILKNVRLKLHGQKLLKHNKIISFKFCRRTFLLQLSTFLSVSHTNLSKELRVRVIKTTFMDWYDNGGT